MKLFRFRVFTVVTVLVGVSVLFSGCEDDEKNEAEVTQDEINAKPSPAPVPAEGLVAFSTVYKNNADSQQLGMVEAVIRSPEEWQGFWAPGSAPAVEVDFNSEMLIAISGGGKATQWSISVESISANQGIWTVHYVETGGFLMAISCPVTVVKTQKSSAPVIFSK